MTILSEKISEEEIIPFTSEIKVGNFEQSLDFYTEKLGFGILRIDKEGKFATLTFNKGQFLIQEDSSVPGPKGVGVFFRFFVPGDIKSFHDSLKEKDIKISKPLKEMNYGLVRFYVEDPDGYQIKFVKNIK